MRRMLPALFLLLAAVPADAQRRDEVPRRPPLPAEADSNDARAWFRLGQELLERRPAEAADAFYWAAQLDPAWADPLYGRYAALLMKEPRRLMAYTEGDPRTLRSREVQAIDSLYARALHMDPFLQPRFDRELIRRYIVAAVAGPYGASGGDVRAAEAYSAEILENLHPLMRGRVMAGEDRLLDALQAYDQALVLAREAPAGLQRMIRHQRARLFAQAGNDSMALAELDLAVQAGAEEERDEAAPFYESKAVLAHSQGIVHERLGNPAAAREAYARALVEDLAYHPAHARLGALALAEGDSATALLELGLAAEAAPEDAPTRLAYATLLARVGRLAEAEAEARAATERAPHYADAWLLLGLVRDGLGGGGALDAYRAFLDRARRDDPRRTRAEQVVAERTAAAPP